MLQHVLFLSSLLACGLTALDGMSLLISSVETLSVSLLPFRGSRVNSCASCHWSGMSGWLANPTSHTQVTSPTSISNKNEEHTPINLPDSRRSFPCRDDATIISTLCGSRRFSAFRSIQQAANQPQQAGFTTMLGSLGASLWKQWRDHELVDSRSGIQETGANLDRECCSNNFQFTVKGEDELEITNNVVHSFRERENLHKIHERKVESAVRGERMCSAPNCMKLSRS